MLGLTATASGGSDTSGFGPLVISAVSSLVLGLLLLVGAVVGLLMVVMRALLRQATTLRTDMEAVI